MITLRGVLAGLGVAVPTDAVNFDRAFAHVVQDSREVQPGDLFVARRGETADGHVFVASAVAHGAAAVLAEHIVETPRPVWVFDTQSGNVPPLGPDEAAVAYILVPDSQRALEQVAAWWRLQMPVDVVGITGSVGKTSTKEVTAAVLSRRYAVLKSERSLNTDVGMALTLLQLTPQHQKAVLEMGMYAQGEIAHLCRLALPRLGIVTNVGPTHLERLGSLEAIAAAKTELVEALPADGVAILNGDDERVLAMSGRSAARVFTYGLTPGLDLWASDIISKGLNGISCTFHYRAESVGIDTPLLGKHSVYAALAAAAAGLALNLTWDEIGSGLRSIPNRLRLVVRQAANGAQIIDDSYNASPSSMLAALDLLEEMNGRHVAVLGDMLELGSFEQEGHRLVGRRVAQVAALLIAVGRRAQIIGEEALRMGMDKGRVFFAGDNAQAVQIARRLVQAGDVVLVKGSRGMKMEEIVTELQPAAEQQ